MTTARPRLEKITADKVLDACRLEVAPEQRKFVSPVAQSLGVLTRRVVDAGEQGRGYGRFASGRPPRARPDANGTA